MGMGPATGAFQNTADTINANGPVQSGMGGKGKGGSGSARPSYQPQSGMGGKGKGGAQQQQQYQQPIQQTPYQPPQQNPYAQQYYQPQFRPQTFNNPYAQGNFGGQMGGFGGKGGQMGGYPQQGGMGGKGGQIGIGDFERRQLQQSGMGGKGGQMGGDLQAPPHIMNRLMQQQGTAGPTPDFSRFSNMMRGQPQGLAALQQPTATTQALTAPEQPYMGNYLQ